MKCSKAAFSTRLCPHNGAQTFSLGWCALEADYTWEELLAEVDVPIPACTCSSSTPMSDESLQLTASVIAASLRSVE